jgi:hypothetical protein
MHSKIIPPNPLMAFTLTLILKFLIPYTKNTIFNPLLIRATCPTNLTRFDFITDNIIWRGLEIMKISFVPFYIASCFFSS